MRSLRWVGLVFSLLIVGVLGGLMAPLPSEAGTPMLTLEVDPDPDGDGPLVKGGLGSMPILLAGATCIQVELDAGYNQCYSIDQSAVATGKSGHKFMAKGADTGVNPRLLISDKANGDVSRLTGVMFYPTTNFSTSTVHTLRVVMTNTFDYIANTSPDASLGMRSGGMFVAGPTPTSPYVTKNDAVTFKGKGKFQGAGGPEVDLVNSSNPSPLSFQEGTSVTRSYFILDQVIVYPSFPCDADGGGIGTVCIPIITLTYDVTLSGPDSFVLTDSHTMKLAGCDKFLQHPKTGAKYAIPCHKADSKTTSVNADDVIFTEFTNEDSKEVTTMAKPPFNALKGKTCTELGVHCTCITGDCKGTIVHVVDIQSDGAGQEFKFKATGEGFGTDAGEYPEIYTITPLTNPTTGKTTGQLPFILPTAGNQWTMEKYLYPAHPDPTKFYWDLDTINCESAKYGTYADLQAKLLNGEEVFTQWTQPSGEPKTGHTVDLLDGGNPAILPTEPGGADKLTCTWNIHSKSINSSGAP